MEDNLVSFILGQAFGVLALICTVVSMQLKKKRSLMILQTASEAFIVAQYFVKGAFTGSLMAIISFVRNIIFTKYDKKRAPFWILLVIYAAMAGALVFSWAGPLSLLPFVGSLVYAWTLWFGKVKWICFGNAVGNSPYLIYTILTGNYVLFAMTLFEVISAVIGFLRFGRKKKTKRYNKKHGSK